MSWRGSREHEGVIIEDQVGGVEEIRVNEWMGSRECKGK